MTAIGNDNDAGFISAGIPAAVDFQRFFTGNGLAATTQSLPLIFG